MPNKSNTIKLLTVIRNPLGGIRTYIKYTYGSLNSRKYQITILSAKEEEKDSDYIKYDLKNLDVKIIYAKGKYQNIMLLFSIFRVLYKSNIDIIHSQGLTAAVLSVLGNAISRKPHIITSHDVFRNDQFLPPLGNFKKKILAFLLGMPDVIQSVGNDAQQNLIDFLPSLKKKKTKLVVIKNGIRIESFISNTDTGDHSLRKGLGYEEDTILFGFLGRFMPQKGFITLIDALEELSRAEELTRPFRVIAFGDGDFIREYTRIIENKNLCKYFIFYGFCPNINERMVDLDAVVMPSLWEAFGLVAAESLIMGCPVIASDCIGLREVVANTPAIIVKSGDSHSLAMAIKNFIMNPEPTKRHTLQFVPLAKQRFNIENTAKQLDELIHVTIYKSKLKLK